MINFQEVINGKSVTIEFGTRYYSDCVFKGFAHNNKTMLFWSNGKLVKVGVPTKHFQDALERVVDPEKSKLFSNREFICIPTF